MRYENITEIKENPNIKATNFTARLVSLMFSVLWETQNFLDSLHTDVFWRVVLLGKKSVLKVSSVSQFVCEDIFFFANGIKKTCVK